MEISPEGYRIFRPRPSVGGRGFLVAGIMVLLLGVILALAGRYLPGPLGLIGFILCMFLGIFFIAFGLFFAWVVRSMRYQIESNGLRIAAGPVNYMVPFPSIRRVYSRDIARTVANRLRSGANGVDTANLALSMVQFRDPGPTRMCATSNSQDITLIETYESRYGINPAEKAEFIAALQKAGVSADFS